MNASMPTPSSDFPALAGGLNVTVKCTVSLNGETGAATTGANGSGDTDFASLLAESDSGTGGAPEQSGTNPVVSVPLNEAPVDLFPAVATEDIVPEPAQITDDENSGPAGEITPDAVPPVSPQDDASVEKSAQPDAAGGAKGRKKPRPIHGLGRFLHACGRHLSTGMKQGQARPVAASSDVPAEIAAAPAKPAAAKEIITPTVCISLHALAPSPRSLGSCGLPAAPAEGVGEETPAVGPEESQTTTESPLASASAGGLREHAAAHRPFGVRFAHRSGLLPSFSKHLNATEATTSSASVKTDFSQSNAPRVALPAAIRAEITATLKTLLAPVMQELAETLSTAVSPAGSANAATIMVKVDGLPPFRIELPPISAAVANPLTAAATPAIETGEPSAVPAEALPVLPASSEIPAAPASTFPAAADRTLPVAPVAGNGNLSMPAPAQVDAVQAVPASSVDFVQLVAASVTAACSEAREVLPTEWPELAAAAPGVVVPASSEEISVLPKEAASVADEPVQAPGLAQPPTNEQPAVRMGVGQETAVPAQATFKVALPGLGTLEAVFAAVTPAAETSSPVTGLADRGASKSETASTVLAGIAASVGSARAAVATGLPEKSAGDSDRKNGGGKQSENNPERIFLSTGNQSVKDKIKVAGIGVAKSDDAMSAPFTSHRIAVDQLELPAARLVIRDFVSPAFTAGSVTESSSAATAETTTPAPVLAHRAVETILNVVEAQRAGLTQASSVNLHFKFGGDDLAVRVQLRGAEVHTQFLTDSPDLRAALASEWQNLASQQGAASSLKLVDPVIMPATAQVSTGFGSASQHHQSAQQQHTSQHQQAQQQAAAFQELRGLRRATAFGTATPAVSEAALRRSPQRAGSLHLAALA